MKDRPLIVLLTVVIILVGTLPLWINLVTRWQGTDISAPDLDIGTDAGRCVESREFMRIHHMQLLDTWRDSVVRDGKRIYTNRKGERFNMSLQNTCMACHQSKERFCDRCHDYMGVTPTCWDCHIEPNLTLEAHPREAR